MDLLKIVEGDILIELDPLVLSWLWRQDVELHQIIQMLVNHFPVSVRNHYYKNKFSSKFAWFETITLPVPSIRNLYPLVLRLVANSRFMALSFRLWGVTSSISLVLVQVHICSTSEGPELEYILLDTIQLLVWCSPESLLEGCIPAVHPVSSCTEP